jgi:hypothetical protein
MALDRESGTLAGAGQETNRYLRLITPRTVARAVPASLLWGECHDRGKG